VNVLQNPWVVRIARLTIGVVFLVAAFFKIADPMAFAVQIHNFRMPLAGTENLIAMTLPWVELLAGAALVIGVKPRAGAVIVFVLMIAFTTAVGVAWGRGLNIECGCFGTLAGARVGARKFAENVVLMTIAMLAVGRLRAGDQTVS
jgi:uncharacterized membrane protein YphA (DoxX/SURF4 family)